MCLVIALAGIDETAPLVVGANRDERLARPAVAATVLRERRPRIVGGRDLQAGGTWLAVNEHGVVAALTNRPGPPDGTKRSRGELPLALTAAPSAGAGVEHLLASVRPEQFNSAWMVVGDRHHLFTVDMSSGDDVAVAELPAGIHVVENDAPGTPTAKVRHVRRLLGDDVADLRGEALVTRIAAVLRVHAPAPEGDGPRSAPCVHGGRYGTRWSSVVVVPADPRRRPTLAVADGPPCAAPFVDVSELFAG